MSRYLADSEENMQQVSSNQGWTHYSEWIESVASGDDSLALHLVEHGYAEPASALKKELSQLPQPEDEDTADVHQHVVGFVNGLPDDEAVIVTD